MSKLPVIILAAGESSRLGSPKQLLAFKGKTLLEHAIQIAKEAQYGPVIVVLGAFYEQIKPVIEGLDIEIVVNHQWKEGMGGSLQVGIRYLMGQYPLAPACLTMLCDQPLLTAQHLIDLRESWAKEHSLIMATQYGGITGVPIVWDSEYFSRLANVEGKIGARKLLTQYHFDVTPLTFEPAARDIDTKEDYFGLQK